MQKSNINIPCADSTLYGISYAFNTTKNEKSLNMPLTVRKLVADTPYYILDYIRAVKYAVKKESYDVFLYDINLQLTFVPKMRVINILHCSLPCTCAGIHQMFGSVQSLVYERHLQY